ALLLGLWSGAREGKREDSVITAWNSLMIAAPPFFLAIVLILIFAVKLKWLPSLGYIPFNQDPIGFLRHMTLPALTLGLTLSAPLARQLRGSLSGVLAQDYIIAAESRGVRWRRI